MLLVLGLLPSLAQAQQVDIQGVAISRAEAYVGETVIAGPDVTVTSTGHLTINAVTFQVRPAFVVERGGALTVYTGDSPVDIETDEAVIPTGFALEQNFPNPFREETEIGFALTAGSAVTIQVYNTLGQRVQTLVDTALPPGFHRVRWDGRARDGRAVPSGLYFYQIQAGPHREVRSMSLVR